MKGTETPTPAVGQLHFAFRLARRFARSRPLARSASIVFVAALFVMAMFITLGTLSLSGAQVADRDLGRFNASVGYGTIVLPPGEDTFGRDLQARALRAGVSDAMVVLSATDVQLPTTPAREVTLLEANWSARPFPERYVLLSGRWPTRPGEVVVTDPQDVPATAGTALSVLGGKVKFQVVGTADDRYAQTSHLLVAPGTWAGMDSSLTDGFGLLGAQPFLLWSGGNPEAVTAAFTAAVQHWIESQGVESESAVPEAVTDTLTTREQLSERPERTWIERTPAGYTVPSLLVPLGAVLLVFGLNDRRMRRAMTSLVSLGVRPTTSAAGLTLATLFWCLCAAVAGTLTGVAIGAGTRAVIASLRDRPPGPIDGLAAPTLRLLGMILLTSLCVGVALAGARHDPTPRSSSRATGTRAARIARDSRHLLAIAAWCATAVYAAGVDSPPKAMILTGIVTIAVLLVIPEVLGLVLKVLPERGVRLRLARRQLSADPRRSGAALAVLTVLLGASLGYLALLDTLIRTADQQAYPDVLPGQLLLADRASITFPPPPAVLRAAEDSNVVKGLPRLELSYVFTVGDSGTVARTATRKGYDGNLLAVDSPTEAEQLIGHRLDSVQTSTLTNGGLLIWADVPGAPAEDPSRTRLVVRSGDVVVGQTAQLPAAAVEVSLADWRIGTDGVLLRSTARDLDLPLPEAGPIMVTGVSDMQAAALQAAIARAGLDARTVRIYMPPPPPIPPAALLATAAGLVVLALAAVLAATRAQARTLRRYLARLVTIGLPTAWARRVLLYQQGVLVAVSTLLGLVIALLPTVVLAFRISGFVLSIPWGQLLILLGAVYLAAALAAAHSVLTLRAHEGLGIE